MAILQRSTPLLDLINSGLKDMRHRCCVPTFYRSHRHFGTLPASHASLGQQVRQATYRYSMPGLQPASQNPYIISKSQSANLSTQTPIPLQQRRPKRIVIAITGATGTVYAIRVLQILRKLNVETHLIISKWALATMKYETEMTESEIRSLASCTYTHKDMSAPISSGSFLHDGMIIVPCSMKTLAAVRTGFCDDLISRAADVSLKERRKLMLVVRETPLNDIHLDNMTFLRHAGAIIFPPVPAFYTRPKSIDDLIDQSVGRMLDAFDINLDNFERWTGFRKD
ncbi:MAG: phenylacrylic acid decarboxylase [Cirrosporium novae-zelandiae]|nr:MAG: phenylacrylic acid decarboxylase [Cirrosporium novae-zelandiae]